MNIKPTAEQKGDVKDLKEIPYVLFPQCYIWTKIESTNIWSNQLIALTIKLNLLDYKYLYRMSNMHFIN